MVLMPCMVTRSFLEQLFFRIKLVWEQVVMRHLSSGLRLLRRRSPKTTQFWTGRGASASSARRTPTFTGRITE